MLDTVVSFQCPICGATDFEELGRRRYAKSEMDCLDVYTRRRYQVLFEIWHSGRKSLELTCAVCRSCGFVTNVPRPSSDDVERKYRFLNEIENEYGKMETPKNSAQRARRLFQACRRWLPPQARILDFGGGDGRLMTDFVKARHTCCVVDYNPDPKSFVTKLGYTLDELDSGDQFDCVIANHVVEHLADPVGCLRRLRGHLFDGGFVFIEVPMEIWRKPPMQSEPVTHVNYFVSESLARGLQAAGFGKIRVRQTSYLHPSGRKLPAVQAWARSGQLTVTEKKGGYQRVRRHIRPTLPERLRYIWSRREDFASLAKYRLFGKQWDN